ncbi:MAG: hypothetical protein Q9184_005797 [Pyrenodesmia sp. 2 TL-2023]
MPDPPSEVSLRDRPLPDVPDRIRIRSKFLLDLVFRITRVKLHYGGRKGSVEERTSLVFLYPFKFFVTFANEIKAEADRLKTAFGHGGQLGQLRTPTSPDDVASSDSAPNTMWEDSSSEKAFEYLTLVTKLMDNYLQPIFDLHESYRNATHDTIFSQDLWRFFETGGLRFQREPLPDYPPRLTRLIHCNGGRQLLNNSEFKSQEPLRDIRGAKSKMVENRFCLNHYHLDFNGEFYGPRGDRLMIPALEGKRSVYDLKLYPLAFVRNRKDHNFGSLNDYKSHLVERGKGFVELGVVVHRYYSGEMIGTHHEYAFGFRDADQERSRGAYFWQKAQHSSFDAIYITVGKNGLYQFDFTTTFAECQKIQEYRNRLLVAPSALDTDIDIVRGCKARYRHLARHSDHSTQARAPVTDTQRLRDQYEWHLSELKRHKRVARSIIEHCIWTANLVRTEKYVSHSQTAASPTHCRHLRPKLLDTYVSSGRPLTQRFQQEKILEYRNAETMETHSQALRDFASA